MAKPQKISGVDGSALGVVAIRTVLRARWDEMCGLRSRALDWQDPEGVHDMRVASRRLRSALKDFTPFVRKRRLRRFRQKIKTIANALGCVRDFDVEIGALEKLATQTPANLATGIGRIAEVRRQRRQRARTELVQLLNSDSLDRTRRVFPEALEAALTPPKKGKRAKHLRAADLTYRDLAGVTVGDRLSELEQLSDCLYRRIRIRRLHQMRIAAKNLRYSLELFAPCWGVSWKRFASHVARLQSTLGDLHDCDVWVNNVSQSLIRQKRELSARRPSPKQGVREALVWVRSHFAKARAKRLREAIAQWREWEASNLSAELRQLIKGPLKLGPSSKKLKKSSTRQNRR